MRDRSPREAAAEPATRQAPAAGHGHSSTPAPPFQQTPRVALPGTAKHLQLDSKEAEYICSCGLNVNQELLWLAAHRHTNKTSLSIFLISF